MPRPTKYTPATVKKITDALSKGATYELAAGYAGISYELMRQWMQDPQKVAFLEAVKKAEGVAALGWLDKIEAAALDGNWQAAAWKLERRYPQMYGRQSLSAQVEVSGKDGGAPISIDFFTFNAVAAALTSGPTADRGAAHPPADRGAGDGSPLG